MSATGPRGRSSAEKVVGSEALRRTLGSPPRERVVVFTNGCFDLLHVGHLGLLERCRALGDVLVVGVNEDASVARLKGGGRPIVPFAERARLLAGLETVDWVVGFSEDTPARLIDALVPDVLAKGGDWPIDRIVGRETVEAHGGRVLSLPLESEHSSSALAERIARRCGPIAPHDRSDR